MGHVVAGVGDRRELPRIGPESLDERHVVARALRVRDEADRRLVVADVVAIVLGAVSVRGGAVRVRACREGMGRCLDRAEAVAVEAADGLGRHAGAGRSWEGTDHENRQYPCVLPRTFHAPRSSPRLRVC